MAQALSKDSQEYWDLKDITRRLKQVGLSVEEGSRLEIIAKAMDLWRKHAETYRTAIIEYKFLANERRKAKIRPLHTVSEKVLKEYPSIRLFRCLDADSALEYLNSLSYKKLKFETGRINEEVNNNPSYRTVVVRAVEFRYRQKNPKKSYCQSYITDEKHCHHANPKK